MNHLETLRAIVAQSQRNNRIYLRVDEDLSQEAGMDGNLARLLQAARELDNAERDPQLAFMEDVFRRHKDAE